MFAINLTINSTFNVCTVGYFGKLLFHLDIMLCLVIMFSAF